MEQVLARVWPVGLAVVMVFLPALGPLVDHHFAERQPYHAHLGANAGHEHDFRYTHAHPSERTVDGDLALYSFDVSSAGPTIALPTDAELQARLTADSAPVLAIHGPTEAVLSSALVRPIERPPRT